MRHPYEVTPCKDGNDNEHNWDSDLPETVKNIIISLVET